MSRQCGLPADLLPPRLAGARDIQVCARYVFIGNQPASAHIGESARFTDVEGWSRSVMPSSGVCGLGREAESAGTGLRPGAFQVLCCGADFRRIAWQHRPLCLAQGEGGWWRCG